MKQAQLRRKSDIGSEPGDYLETINTPPNTVAIVNIDGATSYEAPRDQHFSRQVHFTQFDLPAVITTIAATSDKYYLVTGTNAANADSTISVTGGLQLATHGAANDTSIIIAQTNSAVVTLSATNEARWASRIRPVDIANIIVVAGLDQAPSTTDPTATSGTDMVQFVFDPANALSSGGTVANWLCRSKAASGSVVYISTNVPVAAQDYQLEIRIGTDLKPKFYIDGVLVATGATAIAAVALKSHVSVKALTDTAAKTVRIRYLRVSKNIG